ncbi:MAG: DMT family transporter [Proteobacteria bacterium]|nr:DMT family transporter [Pseudomonadota bacterium]
MRAFPPLVVMIAAIAAGATMDATIKYLSQTNPVLLVALARYAFAAVISFGVWLHAGKPRITAAMWRGHSLRGVIIAVSAVAFFWSLTVLPLAEAVTISFIYPLVAPFVARAMLGERVRASAIVAAIVGFMGVLVAVLGAPSASAGSQHALGLLAVFFSALTFAVSMVMMRARALTDGPIIVGLMASFVPGVIVAAPAIALSPPPRLGDWPVFVFLGGIAALFMYLISNAYARAEAQQLAPIHYTELLWASLYGFALFHETPRLQLVLGATLIIAACLYAAYHERKLAAKAAARPA